MLSKRLGRFQRSKLTVAGFYRREEDSEHSFYQWRRRLAESSPEAKSETLAHGRHVHPGSSCDRRASASRLYPSGKPA